ncbi:MAG: alpha/beta hydrolase [Burkholderiales bacterium]|nr:alpha/beta hydrolase [Anaerolineae bacterium]
MSLADTSYGFIWYADHALASSSHLKNRAALLLIHGAGGTHLDWPLQLRRLPEAYVAACHLPGHGYSPGPPRTTIASYAEDVVALLGALNIEQAYIVGHSMGGAVALTLALNEPERVKGLILISTGAKLRVHADILEHVVDDTEGVVTLVNGWEWSADADPDLRAAGYERRLAAGAETLYADYTACDTFDVRERLPEINVPTLVLGGTDDRMTPFKYSHYLAQNIPEAQLDIIEGGSHMMALEQPQVIVKSIQRWLKKVN